MERLYTLKEAKKLLGVTTKTIHRWDKEGKIRVVRTIGGRRRIPESEIKRILGLKEEGGYSWICQSLFYNPKRRLREAEATYTQLC